MKKSCIDNSGFVYFWIVMCYRFWRREGHEGWFDASAQSVLVGAMGLGTRETGRSRGQQGHVVFLIAGGLAFWQIIVPIWALAVGQVVWLLCAYAVGRHWRRLVT